MPSARISSPGATPGVGRCVTLQLSNFALRRGLAYEAPLAGYVTLLSRV